MINRGSEWRRWEPHIHAPGTVLNNQFGGEDAWENYLSTLEGLSPKIEAIAVTDYYTTETYETVLQYKESGRLPDVKLIFPNVELRLDVAAKSGFVNIHLLVSPEDPDHLNQLRRILARLHFKAYDDRFDCTREDLIALGKRADPSISDDLAALKLGATQFKVNFSALRDIFNESSWAKENILIAVAGASGDGTSGVREAADRTVRQEIEKFAHIIFSSNPAQREFWLGQKAVSVEQLQERYNGCKPCLHGSDSHDQNSVGQPVDDRFTWLKGSLEFDSLRQACIDPEGRAFVGSEPPKTAMPSQVISNISIKDASWVDTPDLPLNPGLVAVIGARGSGKTALVDMIAAGCEAISSSAWNSNEHISPSFLSRARPHLSDSKIEVKWAGGSSGTKFLDGSDADGHFSFPRARYLSQQFVEELCSSVGISDGLIDEIERVIFESYPVDDREGAIDFSELREQKTNRYRLAQSRDSGSIADLSERIAGELEKESWVETLTHQVSQKQQLIGGYRKDLSKLTIKGSEDQARRHSELSAAAQNLREKIQSFTSQKRSFIELQDEVQSTRSAKAPEMLRQVRERHRQSGLTDEQWDNFLLIYKGTVDENLTAYQQWADQQIAKLTGSPLPTPVPKTPLIPQGVDLESLSLSLINAEMKRLEDLLSADKLIRDQYAALSKRIERENAALKALETKLADAKEAVHRRKKLQSERDEVYKNLFEAVINQQEALAELYSPLMKRLSDSSGTLKKLGFRVRRIADVENWGAYAEEKLLDRRKAGPFNGRGSLVALAEHLLKPAWETGSASDIQSAMNGFISSYLSELLKHAPYAPAQQAEFRSWSKQFAHWLYGSEHISVKYEIVYDGVDIRRLSPGTRGIVLLLLYLALDDFDDRPLIIDQPEENLDPKSVFEELVQLFIAAKEKRQVIMVTHNANLVINTDADQIILAEAGPQNGSGLPQITYKAGGLENKEIRKAVCDILEGGEEAFRERARRLRVKINR